MTAETRIAGAQDRPGGPSCPFCGAAWTETMLDQYDALLDPNGCACCGSAGMVEHGEDHHHHEERAVPTTDLCCESCGKPIFRAPGSL
ncbi:MAG: hypothetical protein J0G94_09190 [Sphingomonadales bacterium]|nr:hypothetical protein [Sphingomonadales bacterium]